MSASETHTSCGGQRKSGRREAILSVLKESREPLTADEIHLRASQMTKMGLSTTYRVLAQLSEQGMLLKNNGTDGHAYYQLKNPHSHMHMLHCARCGATVPIDGCPLAALETRLAQSTGYQITGHSLTFTGICPLCQAKAQDAAGSKAKSD